MVELNLLRLCSEKTIFRLFIIKCAEYQLSLYLLYDSIIIIIVTYFISCWHNAAKQYVVIVKLVKIKQRKMLCHL